MRLGIVVLGLFVAFAPAQQLTAQTVNGNIAGTVRDQGGAVIPGAMVTARNQERGSSIPRYRTKRVFSTS